MVRSILGMYTPGYTKNATYVGTVTVNHTCLDSSDSQ